MCFCRGVSVFLGDGIWQPPRYSALLFPQGKLGFRCESGQCRSSACLSPVSRLPTCLSVKAITSGLRAKTASLTLRMRSNRYPAEHTAPFFFFGFQDLGQVPPPPISDLAYYLDARGHKIDLLPCHACRCLGECSRSHFPSHSTSQMPVHDRYLAGGRGKARQTAGFRD